MDSLYDTLFALFHPMMLMHPEIGASVWHKFIMSMIELIRYAGFIFGFWVGFGCSQGFWGMVKMR